MEKLKIETAEFTVPTGYKVTLKKKLTYGEKQQITNEVMGDVEVGQNVQDFKLKFSQASESSSITVFHYLVGWDITENGKALPITLDNVKSTLFEEDIVFLVNKINEFQPDQKKEIGS